MLTHPQLQEGVFHFENDRQEHVFSLVPLLRVSLPGSVIFSNL